MSPVGNTARAFQALAAEQGIDLRAGHALPWLTNRGHTEPTLRQALTSGALRCLEEMFAALGGDEAALAGKAPRGLAPDFLLAENEQLVELDESQHFTTARLTTLDHYGGDPAYPVGGFDIEEYRELCAQLRATSDRDFAHRTAAEFPGRHGRQRQRAYFDAVRDFGAPAFGHGPVIRVAAPERDHTLALQRPLRTSPTGADPYLLAGRRIESDGENQGRLISWGCCELINQRVRLNHASHPPS